MSRIAGRVSEMSDRLVEARKALGYTSAAKAGGLAGVSRTAAADHESGRTKDVPSSYLVALCEAGVSADYLLRGEGPVLRVRPEVEVRAFRFIARYADRVRAISDGVTPDVDLDPGRDEGAPTGTDLDDPNGDT